MTKKQWSEYLEDYTNRMREVARKKNADYTGTGDDPFANFSRVEMLGVCTTLQGMLVRMLDKYCRLTSFSQRGFLLVEDESFEDTCLDLSNYAALLAGVVKSAKLKDKKSGATKHIANRRRKARRR